PDSRAGSCCGSASVRSPARPARLPGATAAWRSSNFQSTLYDRVNGCKCCAALLITVVREKNGNGHAVLTVKTDKGEFVLDNQEERILLWSETSYHYVKRQSQSDPNRWVALGDPRPTTATASSPSR